jgi:hypothetical protein
VILTDQQIRFFQTFGYLHFPSIFSSQEIDEIMHEFELSIQMVGRGNLHDGTRRTMFGGPIEHRAHLCSLLDDTRITGILGGILGKNFNYASGDGNFYTGDTGWHPDGNWGQLFACKLAFYLDPLTIDTGCLRVVPGSHHPNHWLRSKPINPNDTLPLFSLDPRDLPGQQALETKPGDVVIFNHDLFHAAFGGGQRRRMFTMNCTRPCTTDEDLDTLHRYLSVHSAGGSQTRTGAGMFYPTILDTADEARMIHLAQCAAVHDELFPEYRRAVKREA